jgi:hypothetical protein
MSNKAKRTLKATATVVGGLAIAFGLVVAHNTIYSPEKGKEWLESNGYTNVTGGQRDFFNSCGKDVPARSYQATSPNGTRGEETVCFTLLGPRKPWFGY